MSTLDWVIVTIFLSLTVFIGLFYTKKASTIKDYALGGRKFSTATLSATIIATWISGSSLSSSIREIYFGGLSYIFSLSGWVLIFLVIAVFFIPRMGEFLGKLSIAQAMGDIYGREVRIVTIICGFFCGVCTVSAQFKVVSNIVSYFLETQENYALYLVSIIVILYSCYGGVRAVAITDVLQACSFAIFLPSVCLFIWSSFDSKSDVISAVSNNPMFQFDYTFSSENPNLLSCIALFIYLVIPAFNPAVFQRVAIAKDLKQAQKAFFIAFACTFIITIFSCTIGVLIWAKNPNLQANQLIGYFIESCSYPGMLGLTIVGILSMMMSTADSYINSSAVLISYDLPDSFNIKLSSQQQLNLSRICTLVIGIAAIAIASRYQRLLDIFITATSVYTVVSVTFILAVFGFRSTSKCVFIGMAFGLTTMFIWKGYFEESTKINCFVPSFIANLLGLLLSHYILRQPGGWVGIKDVQSYNAIMSERKEFFSSYIEIFKNFNLLFTHKNNVPTQTTYLYSSLIVIISTFIGMCSTSKNIATEYSIIISLLEQSSLVLATIFITYAIFWFHKIETTKYVPIFWIISMFYTLIFASTILAIINDFSTINILILIINNIFILSLIDWRVSLPLSSIVVLMSILFLNFTTDINFTEFENFNPNGFYVLITIFVTIIAFIRPKQIEIDILYSKNTKLNKKLKLQSEELIDFILKPSIENSKFMQQLIIKLTSFVDILSPACKELKNTATAQDIKSEKLLKEIEYTSEQIQLTTQKLLSFAGNKFNSMKLDVKHFDFVELLEESVQTIKSIYPTNARIQFYLDNAPDDVDLNGDKFYISYLISNLLLYAMKFSDAGIIKIEASETSLSYDLEQLGVKNVKAIKFSITGNYQNSTNNISNLLELDLYSDPNLLKEFIGISICKKIIKAHYGKIFIDRQNDELMSIDVILPINVYDVRPKKLDVTSEISDSRIVARLFSILEDEIGIKQASSLLEKLKTKL